MKQNLKIKIAAIIALFWIIIWVVWTWVLVIYETYFSNNSINQEFNTQDYNEFLESLSQEELEELMKDIEETEINNNQNLPQEKIENWELNKENNQINLDNLDWDKIFDIDQNSELIIDDDIDNNWVEENN